MVRVQEQLADGLLQTSLPDVCRSAGGQRRPERVAQALPCRRAQLADDGQRVDSLDLIARQHLIQDLGDQQVLVVRLPLEESLEPLVLELDDDESLGLVGAPTLGAVWWNASATDPQGFPARTLVRELVSLYSRTSMAT